MSTDTATLESTPAVETVAKAPRPKAKAKPKTTPKASANGKAKTVEAPAAKTNGNGGLRKAQVRILKALEKAGKPLTRSQLAVKAPVDVAACTEYLGSHDEAVRKANDKKHFPSLITLGYVKASKFDVDGKDIIAYSLMAKGKQIAAKS